MTERAVVMTKPSSRVACGPIVGNMQPPPVFFPRGSFPPVSNTERQRQFRERNPGYYGRLHAKSRAECKARVAAALAAVQQVALPVPPVTPVLMLPAPVQDPAMAALNAMAAKLKSKSAAAEPVMIPRLD